MGGHSGSVYLPLFREINMWNLDIWKSFSCLFFSFFSNPPRHNLVHALVQTRLLRHYLIVSHLSFFFKFCLELFLLGMLTTGDLRRGSTVCTTRCSNPTRERRRLCREGASSLTVVGQFATPPNDDVDRPHFDFNR